MTDRTIVAGVDLSQRGLGLVAVPEDYRLRWGRVQVATFGHSLKQHAPEFDRVARLGWLVEQAIDFLQRTEATHVWIEGYPKSGRVFNLDIECELGGALRYAIWRDLHMTSFTAQLSTARKLLLGKLPRAETKRIVHRVVRDFGVPDAWTGDIIDAWVAANHGLSLLGVQQSVCAAPVPA